MIHTSNITTVVAEKIGHNTNNLLDGAVSSHRGGVDHLLLDDLWVGIVVLRANGGLKLSLSGPHESWTDEGWGKRVDSDAEWGQILGRSLTE